MNESRVPLTNQGYLRLFKTWQSIIQRCENPRSLIFKDYGGRGISICREWRASFDQFANDLGDPPSDRHSLDRIDNDGDYVRSNVRWATAKEQQRNTRKNRSVTYRGVSMCLAQALEESGTRWSRSCIVARLKRGWTADEALIQADLRHASVQSDPARPHSPTALP